MTPAGDSDDVRTPHRTQHRYNTRLRSGTNHCEEVDMAPRKRRMCKLPSDDRWSCYKRNGIIITSVVLILTGAYSYSYFSMDQDIDVQQHIYNMIEKQTAEIVNALSVLKRITSNVQSNMHKCRHSAEPKLVERVRNVVREELDFQNADKTGKPDYALASTGAYIIGTRQTEPYDCAGRASLFGIPLCPSTNGPNALIQPGVMPGECWAFKGQSGTVLIRLITKIYVTGVSLEHIARSISPNGEISTAPKDFSIWGLQSPDDEEAFFFGQYTYDTKGTPIQHFSVVHKCLRMFDVIEFKIHSNHGHPEFTCIYRLRVHGDLGDS